MKIKNTLRQLRIKLGKFLLDVDKLTVAEDFIPKKILFLRQDGKIGDYIVSSFVFRELKKQDPNIHIGVVCTPENAFLFNRNSYIDQLYFVKKRSILSAIKCGLHLRKLQYDVLIDPTMLLRNRDLLLLRLINARINIGYQKSQYKIFNKNIEQSNLHFSDVYKHALQMLGFKEINSQYDIPLHQAISDKVRAFLVQNSLTRFIAVNFYGSGSARRFNDKKILDFLAYLTNNTTLPILLLTHPEVTRRLKKLSEPFDLVFIDEKADTIFHSIEYIRHCKLLISPDTATIHIAAGLNKPIITFYNDNQENFIHWHPNNQNITHILRYHENINEITPEQINRQWINL